MMIKLIASMSVTNAAGYLHKPDAVFLASNMAGRSPQEVAREFKLLNTLHPLKHEVIHVIISHPPGERVTPEQARYELQQALQGLGYGNCPFHALEHLDTTKQHFHALVSPIDYEGHRIDRGGDRFQCKKIARRLERELGLQIVSSTKNPDKTVNLPEPAAPEIQAADLQPALYAVILPAIKRNTTIGELADDLLRHGVQMEASFGTNGATGLGYRLLGDPGGYLTASEVHGSFTLAKLKSKHKLTYDSARDDAHLAQMKKRPSQPVQPILAALAEPAPASPRVQRSADEITFHLLNAYRTKRPYAQAPYTIAAAHAAQVPSPTFSPRRPTAPAVAAALLSAGLRRSPNPPDGKPGGPVRGVVQPGPATPAPGRPDHAQEVGDRVPLATPGLEGAEQSAPGTGVPPPSRHDPRPNLDDLRPHPSRGGDAPVREGGSGTPGGPAPAAPGVHAADGGLAGGREDRGQRPEGPGAAPERQQDAPGGPDRAAGAAPAPGARTGIGGVGGIRGPGSPDRRTPGRLSQLAQEALRIAQKIMDAIPRIPLPMRRKPPLSPTQAMDLLMHQVQQRELELRLREERQGTPQVKNPEPPEIDEPDTGFHPRR